MAYVHGPLDPELGIPVRDVEAIRRHVDELHKARARLSPAVAERVSRILYSGGSTGPAGGYGPEQQDPSSDANAGPP